MFCFVDKYSRVKILQTNKEPNVNGIKKSGKYCVPHFFYFLVKFELVVVCLPL